MSLRSRAPSNRTVGDLHRVHLVSLLVTLLCLLTPLHASSAPQEASNDPHLLPLTGRSYGDMAVQFQRVHSQTARNYSRWASQGPDDAEFTLHFPLDDDGEEKLLSVTLSSPQKGLDRFYVVFSRPNPRNPHDYVELPTTRPAVSPRKMSLKIPQYTLTDILRWEDIPDTLRIDVFFETPLINYVSARLENVYALEPATYHVNLPNTSFNTRFLLEIAGPNISWIVKRRAPIPDFVAALFDRDGNVVRSTVERRINPEGMHFQTILDRNAQEDRFSALTLSVEFYEEPRAYDYYHEMTHAFATLHKHISANSPPLEIPLGGAASARFIYREESNAFDLWIIQPFPIRDLMVVLLSDNRTTMASEAVRHVPYIPADSPSSTTHYGWKNLLPLSMITRENLSTMTLIVRFNRDLSGNDVGSPQRRLEELLEWLEDNGAYLHPSLAPVVHREEDVVSLGLSTGNEHIPEDTVLAEIPGRVFMTKRGISQDLKVFPQIENSVEWGTFLKDHQLQAHHSDLTALTLGVILGANAVEEGTHYTGILNTLDFTTVSRLPMSWSEEERIRLFGKSSSMNHEIAQHLEMWNDEYATLARIIDNQERLYDKERFLMTRSALYPAIYKAKSDGHLFVPPLASLIHHSDEPTVAELISDEGTMYQVRTTRDLLPHTELSTDKGVGTKNMIEFLVGFGILPRYGLDIAVIEGISLTRDRQTNVRELRKVIRKNLEKKHPGDTASEADINREFQYLLTQRLEQLPRNIPSHASEHKHRVDMARRVLAGERGVLQAHLDSLADGSSDL